MSKRYAHVIDLEICVGCKGCVVSCKNVHDLPAGTQYSWVHQEGPTGVYPKLSMYYLPRLCMQCSNPECDEVCPSKATYIDENGVVRIDEDLCIGCEYCIWACPYQARTMHPEKHMVQKCDMCAQLTSQGQQPNCTSNCFTKARYFGDLNDPNSDVSIVLAKNPERVFRVGESLGSEPNVYYLRPKRVVLK